MIVLEPNDPSWAAFVESCPDASPFHHPSWLEMLSDCYGYRGSVLAATNQAGEIVAGVPALRAGRPLGKQRLIALPFTDSCPILSRGTAASGFVSELVAAVKERRLQPLELRTELAEQPYVYRRADAVRHTQALTADPSATQRRFSKMHQRNIRKAEQAGVQIIRGTSPSDMQNFYRLHVQTRQRLGVPVQPRRFFDLLTQRILEPGLGFILSAVAEQRTIASAVFMAWNGTVIYKFGASDAEYWKHRPNNLLFWTALRWACENGYHSFDWGRTDLDDEGLREFKRGWGASEEPLTYSAISNAPPSRGSHRVERALGTIIRHSPQLFTRAIGECLYKYSA